MVGGGEFNEAESTIKYALKISYVATIVPSITLALLIGVIGRLFTDDPAVLTLLAGVAIADVFLEFGRVMNVVFNRAIKASGDARYPLISIIIVEWIFILPLAYLLGDWLQLGLLGIWIALALDEVVRGINLFIRWKSKRWQIKSKTLNQHIHASANEQN